MSESHSLRVRRPYASAEEYLAAEAWSIDSRSVLLIDEPELPAGDVVKFEIVLEDGSKPIRAEGVVYKAIAPRGKRPGGLRVKLKRMGAQTKAFIDRALAEKKAQRSIPPPPPPAAGGDGSTDPSEITALTEITDHGFVPEVGDELTDHGAASSKPSSDTPPRASGVRHAKVERVDAPPNREELLERLRERASALRKTNSEQASEESA